MRLAVCRAKAANSRPWTHWCAFSNYHGKEMQYSNNKGRPYVVHVALREDTQKKTAGEKVIQYQASTPRKCSLCSHGIRSGFFFQDFPPSTPAPASFLGLYPVCFQNAGNSVLFKIISFSLINIIATE